jgi:DNA-directed RNA polymerase subunit RPC12/RpoP
MARTVTPPTLEQWGCVHEWRVQHTRRVAAWFPHKRRYYRCGRCGLRLVTEERPAVAWNGQALVAMLREILPEGEEVYLRDKGIATLGLYALNAVLESMGLMVVARKVRDARRFVACRDRRGGVEPFGLFALRRIEEDEDRDSSNDGI